MLTPSSGNTIAVEEDYVRIEGIAALADPDTGDTYAFLKIPSGTISADNDIRMTECLINGNNAKHRVTMLEDSDTNLIIRNTIAYNQTQKESFYFYRVNTAYCYNWHGCSQELYIRGKYV